MKAKVQIRKVEKQDLDFVYKAICELENEILDFEVFEIIFNENISNSKNLYLMAENENEGVGFISFHTQNLLHHYVNAFSMAANDEAGIHNNLARWLNG